MDRTTWERQDEEGVHGQEIDEGKVQAMLGLDCRTTWLRLCFHPGVGVQETHPIVAGAGAYLLGRNKDYRLSSKWLVE